MFGNAPVFKSEFECPRCKGKATQEMYLGKPIHMYCTETPCEFDVKLDRENIKKAKDIFTNALTKIGVKLSQ